MNANLAMAHYKLKDYTSCVDYCDKALRRRKTMPKDLLEKNLYRKASAESELSNYESCVKTCEELLALFPSNAAGAQLLRSTQRELAAELRAQKTTYAKVFQKLETQNSAA